MFPRSWHSWLACVRQKWWVLYVCILCLLQHDACISWTRRLVVHPFLLVHQIMELSASVCSSHDLPLPFTIASRNCSCQWSCHYQILSKALLHMCLGRQMNPGWYTRHLKWGIFRFSEFMLLTEQCVQHMYYMNGTTNRNSTLLPNVKLSYFFNGH